MSCSLDRGPLWQAIYRNASFDYLIAGTRIDSEHCILNFKAVLWAYDGVIRDAGITPRCTELLGPEVRHPRPADAGCTPMLYTIPV